MKELSPGTGVYVYEHTTREALGRKKASGVALYLMSVFYTHEELLEAKGLAGVDGTIVSAILGKHSKSIYIWVIPSGWGNFCDIPVLRNFMSRMSC